MLRLESTNLLPLLLRIPIYLFSPRKQNFQETFVRFVMTMNAVTSLPQTWVFQNPSKWFNFCQKLIKILIDGHTDCSVFGDICILFPLLSVMSPHVFSLVQRHNEAFWLAGGWTTRQPCGDWDLLTEFDLKQFHSKTVPIRSQIELFVIV